jgi:hypothetical protein
MNLKIFFSISIASAIALLGYCTSVGSSAQTVSQDPRISALASWMEKGPVLIIDVPAARNALSNMMLVSGLKTGSGSLAVSQIVQTLKSLPVGAVAVMGDKASVTEATVLAALKELKASTTKTQSTLILVGEVDNPGDLDNAANEVGVTFVTIKVP